MAQRWSDERQAAHSRQPRSKERRRSPATIASLDRKTSRVLSGSAIGIYGQRGDEVLDESSTLGDDFLASVCKEWEAATQPAADAGIRVVNLRTGIVLSPRRRRAPEDAAAISLRGRRPARASERQWMSWIALADYVDAVRFSSIDASMRGPGQPRRANPVTNEEFTRVLARVLGVRRSFRCRASR